MAKTESARTTISITPSETGDVPRLVEHLFRHQSGQMVATLTRFFGLQHLDLVEDVVQETLLKALQQWTYRGIPENPKAWIMQTAKHHAIDVLRRQARFRDKQQDIAEQLSQVSQTNGTTSVRLDSELKDDQLRMMFACCHPVLSPEVRVALTLKTLCGFSVTEIARAFLTQEPTIAQRLVRAKRKIREESITFEVPNQRQAQSRLESLLEVLYLLFNEGYSAHSGENLVRADLCSEAIRLTQILIEHDIGNQPSVHALLALMFLQSSRLPARLDDNGKLLLLQDQDRSKWNRQLIQLGLQHLERSAKGKELSEYHLQAGIAACHTVAKNHEHTDWPRILAYYDELTALNHSPVIALNRAVALSMVEGPKTAIQELQRLQKLPIMKTYYLLPATYAELYHRLGETDKARQFYYEALRHVGTDPEREFLLQKIHECEHV